MPEAMLLTVIGILVVMGLGILAMMVKCYVKVDQGKALIRNGMGGAKVAFSGTFVFPVIHRAEVLDLSVKRVEIHRTGKEGLVCKDNMRADIKVAFFVRVNKTAEDALKVAQSLGCERASKQQALVDLFDAKFSEALKTVGKQFDFVELYEARERFKNEILQIIGTDLNGFVLDDCAIDYLEQTPLEFMNPDNILDSEGIKKITQITAQQKVLSNQIDRDREMTITKQDVEAREAILALNRQLAETEAKQKREIDAVQAREQAEAQKIVHEERLKAERARIQTDEELQVADENRQRQVIVAEKSKQRTQAVEQERVEKDRLLEVNERERIVALAEFEKDRAIEQERKNIQELIRERIVVEKAVVEEQERIKDVQAQAEADRVKNVQVTRAEMEAQEALVRQVKAADAAKQASELEAAKTLIEAEAAHSAATKKAEAMKTLADARATEEATLGMSEVRVMEARASAITQEGTAEATVIERKATAEATGIRQKAESMKLLDGIGKDHEEFKLRLQKERDIDLAQIQVQRDIADAQAKVLSEALRHANIEIVGGETAFFDKIVSGISQGRYLDRLVQNSSVLSEVKDGLLRGDGIGQSIKDVLNRFGVNASDVRDLSMAKLLWRLAESAPSEQMKGELSKLQALVEAHKIGDQPLSNWIQ